MKEQAGAQYTIQGVPPEVDRLLRRKAAKRKQSLSQVIVDELAKAVASGQRKADFSEFVGKWIPGPAFDELVAAHAGLTPKSGNGCISCQGDAPWQISWQLATKSGFR